MTDLTNPIFTNEKAARRYLEAQRWPDGPYCPHCGSVDVTKLRGKAHRPGVHQCKEKQCRQQFTVTVGTVFERSKIPVHKWLLATHLLSASKKGMSAHQLHRMLGVTYKTAWFMAHRIREAMAESDPTPMGGTGQIVEADEAYYGPVRKKRAIIGLVERGGRVRSFHVKSATSRKIREIRTTNVPRDSILHTDESPLYTLVGREYARHETVNHTMKEYSRGDVTTNTIEGFFSIFKRGMSGVYQHCGEQHLKRYLSEFDFRYNHRTITDAERRDQALRGITGKRLTYRRIGAGQASV